jgi:hypothetical protein
VRVERDRQLSGRLAQIVRHRTTVDAERSTALTVDFAAGLQGELIKDVGTGSASPRPANVFAAAMAVFAENKQVLGFQGWE